MLDLAPDLKLLTPAEHLLERQVRDLIAAARQHGESGPLTVHVALRSDFAEELGVRVHPSQLGLMTRLICTVDPKN